MTKVVGYIRVSTINQAKEGYSLDEQIDEIKKYCSNNDFNLVGIFEDGGKSGATDEDINKLYKRDGLLELFDKLETDNTIQFVVVLNTNRLWRDEDASYLIKKKLRQYNIDIRSIDQETYSIYKSDNPYTKLVNNILENLDEFQRDEITLKLKRGRKKKAEGGGYSGGGAPYGYRAVRGTKVLEIDPEEARGVQKVFDLAMRCPDMTLREIAAQMSLEGYRGRKGGDFGAMLVKRILDKEDFYKGLYKYGEVESIGQHDPIL